MEYGTKSLAAADRERVIDRSIEIQRLTGEGEFARALQIAVEEWSALPGDVLEEKVLYPESQFLSGRAMKAAAGAGQRDLALLWVDRFEASYGRVQEPTQLTGRGEALYLLGDLEQASSVFKHMLETFGKAAFRGKNADFLKLAQGKKVAGPAVAPAVPVEVDGDEVDRLAEVGNEALEEGRWERAVEVWSQALTLIPEPRETHEETVWLCGSLADAFFQGGRFEDALVNAERALDASDRTNGFLWLRRGQAEFELGQRDAALNSLTSAFMLEGAEIFEEDDPKYLEFLRSEGVKGV